MKKLLFLLFCLFTHFGLYSQDSFTNEFSESFDDATISNWKTRAGSWVVENSKLNAKNGFGYLHTLDARFSQYSFESDVSVGKIGNAGLIFNVSTHSSIPDVLIKAYYFSLDAAADSVCLSRVLADPSRSATREKVKIIALPVKIEPGETYRLKVHRKGNYIDCFLNGEQLVSIQEKTLSIGSVGMLSENAGATFDNVVVKKLLTNAYNWSWVKGAIYIPSNCVNQVQQWEEFDASVVDRELRSASVYGLNSIRIYLHYLVYEKDKQKFISDLETFLKIADKYRLKTIVSFFDDVWDGEPHLGPQLPPVTGRHNKRWAQCPGNTIKENYGTYKEKLKAYVQDVVKLHLDDSRILFWEPYNEPGFLMKGKYLEASRILLNDSRIWVKETGTQIPVTSTADPDFIGKDFSDFYSWHSYDRSYEGPYGPDAINTECMNRSDQTLAGLIDNYSRKQTGFIIWELMIGQTNSRFHWISPENSPEPSMPFQGLVYPDGHPWDTNEVVLLHGPLHDLPVFNVKYFTGNFEHVKKWSITPAIDFELGDERGTGSPDASIGIDKDHFSIRWTGLVQAEKSGEHTFYIQSDNVARLWIGKDLVLDKKSPVKEEVKNTIKLNAGKLYDLKVEYYHNTGNASMKVSWQKPGSEKEILPGKRPVKIAPPATKENMFSTD